MEVISLYLVFFKDAACLAAANIIIIMIIIIIIIIENLGHICSAGMKFLTDLGHRLASISGLIV